MFFNQRILLFIKIFIVSKNTIFNLFEDKMNISQNNNIKTANISYSCNEVRKTLAVPFIDSKFSFATQMTDPVWNQAIMADDFVRFGKKDDSTLDKKSIVKIFRTATKLYIGWFYFNEKEARKYPDANLVAPTPWHGDLAEIHFGSMAPDPWHLQICIGITGINFDSSGNQAWEVDIFENQDGWGAEFALDISQLSLTEGGVGFTICRCDMLDGKFYTWSNLTTRFHEVENFGELLFDNYNTIYTLRSGKIASSNLTRAEFEKLRNTYEIDAKAILHGPYISNPESNSVCINWATAGKLPAFIEYKIKDSDEKPTRILCSKQHGILASEETHFAHLENLQPDTTYQYELFTLTPVTNKEISCNVVRYFHTAPAKGKDFSFLAVTDLHSNAQFLTNALTTPAGKDASFHLLLGDNLSHAAGRNALYNGVIDPIVLVNQDRKLDTPVVFVRGNHEQLGVFALEYFNVMRHYTGKSWYAFSYGDCFFIILDSGNDSPDKPEKIMFSSNDLLKEQKLFLEKIVNLPEYQNAKYRIGFMHIPPLRESDPQGDLIKILADAKVTLNILLCGHWHEYIKVEKNTSSFAKETDSPVAEKLKTATILPFPRVVLSTDNALNCKVSQDNLTFEVWKFFSNNEAKVVDTIVVK